MEKQAILALVFPTSLMFQLNAETLERECLKKYTSELVFFYSVCMQCSGVPISATNSKGDNFMQYSDLESIFHV